MPHQSGTSASDLEEFEVFFRLAPVGLCVVDRDLRYARANDAYATIVNHTVDALIGRRIRDVIPESAREEAISAIRRVIEQGESVLDLELRRVVPNAPDLERVWLANIHPLERDGEITGAMAVLQEITAVRLAEETANRRLNELESIYRNAPIGLSFTDRDLRYVRVNQQIADWNGLSIEEIVGKTYRDPPAEIEVAAKPMLRAIMEKGETVRNLEIRAGTPADPEGERIFLLSAEPVRDAVGGVAGLVTAVQDVTEQRHIEEAAARRLKELEVLYASATVGLCHMDPELRIVHLNPRFAQLRDWPLEQQVGATAEEVLPEPMARLIVPNLRYVARTGISSSPIEVRGRLANSDEREYTWMVHIHPVASEKGGVAGLITVLQDVTVLADRQREIETVRDRLAEAQSVSRVGSWEWNILEDKGWWSNELYEILGESLAYHPTFDRFFEHIHPSDREMVRDQIERTLSDDRPYRVTFRVVRPDGGERVLFASARLERTPGGLAARLVGTCQDVTERSARPRVARRRAHR
ncbi:MAG: PAS domain-containing protein [Myxococcota bacterium]